MPETVTEREEVLNPNPEMTLSEAILAGIVMRPKAARGVYFAGEDKSDVFGAAYQGMVDETEVHNHQVGNKLDVWFPILAKKVNHPESGKFRTLKEVIRELNDVQKWKRKNIARFVATVESRHN